MEERGLYITLLSIQWSKNVIPKKRLALILGMEWENVPELIKEKFIDKGDYLINERLFNVSEERKTYVEKQRLNGQKGGRPKTQTKPKITPSLKMKMKIEDEIENIDIVYPYLNDEFIQIWNQFKIYKSKEFNFKYKSTQSEQAALSKLSNDSENEAHAIELIKLAMANGWKGIYPDKTNNYGGKNNTNKSGYSTGFKEEIIGMLRS
jgi:uncharacterized protein YdaU (DUF1376 family)